MIPRNLAALIRAPLNRRRILRGMPLAGTTALAASAATSGVAQPTAQAAQAVLRADGSVSVLDFMPAEQAQRCRDGVLTDSTAAFTAAQRASLFVTIPQGRFGLRGLRIINGLRLSGAGQIATTLEQLDPRRPAIDCLSDADSGQLLGLDITGFTVRGHPEARAPAVQVVAHDAYAVTRSNFDYYAERTFRALEIQGPDAANVYNCRFHVVSEGTSGTAVLVNGAVYNRYDLFLTQCAGLALEDGSDAAEIRVVSDNCLLFRGQRNRISAQIEDIHSSAPPRPMAIEDRGFGNTYDTPTVVLMGASAKKLVYAFKAFSQTLFLNPQIIAGPGNRLHPFARTELPFTVMGGRSSAAHKLEAEFDGSDNSRSPGNVTFVGDPGDFRGRGR